ncbi:serine--tRNA ligase [Candidatus Daviesbacteria bacterium RIFCSPLOWO2_01_FULL_39_12]|uniref:Serine--tRNA ligase n=1 Tax=Candidatus Daviesbacteria bacterium RIFCSPLOWO2_01_FULL_39_12 TaxID=1797785 RepID=A0A1F5KPH2_9BACT|nr:MAG: serine--tRNA ligase [Candidatus Daviesbacteria bacterium RIFCSPHIGHO2_02_FULL_39_8]OGE42719.1 MAG: serine--tRNA ligase [Candidatus Daviesbacteria bacterium RIFCSPLOWO2_01_FULL_39_12]
MLDINFIRENLEKVKKDVEARKVDVDLEKLLKLDEERRELIAEVDEIRAKRNVAAKDRDIETGKKIKGELDRLEKQLTRVEKEWNQLMLQVPNIIMDEVPIGDASKNKVIRKEGKPPKFSFKVKDHIELGKSLDIIDFERGVKVAGFRGYYLKNEGARLHWAVLNFALDHLAQKGYQIVIPPVINKGFALLGGGQFPWGEEDTYKLGDDEYLVGTSEIPLMALHAEETFDIKDLPKKYAALTACFRTEIGSYGKDTKGLYRVHEFYKVEQVVLCEADEKESLGFFEELQENSEEILEMLGLPYQVVCLSSQDMGKKAALTYDIETWMPSREGYGETHSNSICLDFQTRRLKIKYRTKDGTTRFCHALNNTAIASPRILIALLENFQQADGSIKIPEVLQKYTGFTEIRPK